MLTMDGITAGSKAGVWTRPYHDWFNRNAPSGAKLILKSPINTLHIRYRVEGYLAEGKFQGIDAPQGVRADCRIRRRETLYAEVIFKLNSWYQKSHEEFQLVFGKETRAGYLYMVEYARLHGHIAEPESAISMIDGLYERFFAADFSGQFVS